MNGPRRPRPRRRRVGRGFTIIEMMLALGLLATFALVAVHLMTTSIRLSHEAAATQDRALRFDDAVGLLRRDVWGAARVEARSPGTAWVTLADGATAVWSTDADGGLSRTLSAPDGRGYPSRQTWAAVAPGLTFEVSDGVLLLVEPIATRAPRRRRPAAPSGAAAAAPAPVRRMPIIGQSPAARRGEGGRP